MNKVGNTCWVTGAFGFIGRRVSLELARQGRTVLGVGHGSWPSSEAKNWGLSFWLNGELNGSNFNSLRDSGGIPSEIYHLAGGASVSAASLSPLEDFRRNAVAAAELLEWVRQESPSTKIIVASSAAVYGNGYSVDISEDLPSNPFSVYGFNKSIMESLCRSYGFNFGIRSVTARIFSVYGIGLRKQLLWDSCTKLRDDPGPLKLSGSGAELRDWVHVEDTVTSMIKLGEIASSASPIVNIGTGKGTSVRYIATTMRDLWDAGSVQPAREIRFDGSTRPGDPTSLVADVSKLSSMGIKLERKFEVEAENFVKWYRSLGA